MLKPLSNVYCIKIETSKCKFPNVALWSKYCAS